MSIQDDLKRARKRHATNQERAEDARARLKDVDEAIDDTREDLRTLRQRAKDLDHHGPHWEDLRSQVEELEEDLTRFLGRFKEILEHEKDFEEAAHAAHERAEQLRKKLAARDPDARLEGMLEAYGLSEREAKMVTEEASRAHLQPAQALALIAQESGFKNIFGCDHGSQGGRPPYCHEQVTRDRCLALRNCGTTNGVGWTQLTSVDYVDKARALGGEWEIRNQCRVGFELLKGNIDWGGEFKGFGAYNGGRGNPIAAYAESCLALKKQWQARIDNAVH